MNICILCPLGHSVVIHASKLGGEAICPRCCVPFHAQLHLDTSHNARPEKGKAGSSRDDEEKPQKKKPVFPIAKKANEDENLQKKASLKPAKKKDDEDDKPENKPAVKPGKNKDKNRDEEEDEDEKPRAKKSTRKKDEDDEDEDEEEEGEEGEEEEPIYWTLRKRQLNLCSAGLVPMMVACYMLIAVFVFAALGVDIIQLLSSKEDREWSFYGGVLIVYVALPLLYLALTALVVSMFMSLRVPPKAEAKSPIIAGLVFASVVYVLGLVALLTLMGLTTSDAIRGVRMMQLLVGASVLFFVLAVISLMVYLAKLLKFMKLHLESSQPITNAAFAILCLLAVIVLHSLSDMLRSGLGDWMAYVIAAVSTAAAGCGTYILILHIQLVIKLCTSIATFIKDG
jgi:hypothetical protein